MNKIKSIFSSLKPYLTPKFFTLAVLAITIIFGLFMWLRTKNRESIKEHQFLVATDNSWYPLDLHGQEQYMQGFVSELMEFIANDEEIRLQLISIGTSQFFDNLEKGYYDGVISGLSPNVLNQEKYLFSEPFYRTGPVLIVPANSKAANISDLHTVGIKTGTFATFAVSGQPLTSTISFDSINTALSELMMGRIDGVILDSLDAYAYIQGLYKGKFRVASAPLNNQGLRLITKHDFFGKALIKIFNEGLEKAKEEKIYDKILQKWDLVNPETAFEQQ